MANPLNPGAGGPAAPSPKDQKAVSPKAGSGAGVGMPVPGPSAMEQHFSSQEDQLAQRFAKVKEAKGRVDTTMKALGKLVALADTVTMDDIVDAAGEMVAGGSPAAQVAAILAEAPEQQSQLQGWVAGQAQKVAKMSAQVDNAMKQTGAMLGIAAIKNLMGTAAESHFVAAKTRGMH